MNSVDDTAEAVGCPIRKSTDQSLLAAPHGLSQRAASFIASQCQGIHQMPFRRLISTNDYDATRRRKPTRLPSSPHASGKDASHDPTDAYPCRTTALSGHPRSLILFTCQRSHTRPGGYLCSLADTCSPGSIGRVTVRHCTPPGGGGRDRTDDLMLAKHALSQLSYAPTEKDQDDQWWAREDLNFRPHAYQARALTN